MISQFESWLDEFLAVTQYLMHRD